MKASTFLVLLWCIVGTLLIAASFPIGHYILYHAPDWLAAATNDKGFNGAIIGPIAVIDLAILFSMLVVLLWRSDYLD